MKKNTVMALPAILLTCFSLFSTNLFAQQKNHTTKAFNPSFKLVQSEKFYFNNFVDCNMAEAWVADTFRIFPGKYGEDTLWGNARDLKFAGGLHPDEAFSSAASGFTEPVMPPNVAPGEQGLHGAVWFETIYQDSKDASGKILYAVYHNENYPDNFPYDAGTGKGYKKDKWPQGLQGPTSPAAVCRIGIMKSVDGGWSWLNKGIFLEDNQPRLILKPHNTSNTFAGGVGDPSAVASGDYLYLFYGEYSYPGKYDEKTYSADKEWGGQCISVARILLSDLDTPEGKAKRWDGKGFNAPYDGIGKPIASLPAGGFYWGPSVSWNTYLGCWVMLMGKSTGPSWAGSSLHIAFNKNKDLGKALQSQQWTPPRVLLDKPGYFLWYPSLQPMNTAEDMTNKNTCLKLGRKARLFVKNIKPEKSEYFSEYIIEFSK
jgi:hypothetical protein